MQNPYEVGWLGETVTAPLRLGGVPETVAVVSCTEDGTAGDDSLVFYSESFEILSKIDLREQFQATQNVVVSGIRVRKGVVLVDVDALVFSGPDLGKGTMRVRLPESGEPEIMMIKRDAGSDRFNALMTAARKGDRAETAKYTTTDSGTENALELFGYLPRLPETVDIDCDTDTCMVYTVEDLDGVGLIFQVSATIHGTGDQETFGDFVPMSNAG